MNKLWEEVYKWSVGITTLVFSFISEGIFGQWKLFCNISDAWNITINRILFLVVVGLLSLLVIGVIRRFSSHITLKGSNYEISVEYGDIFKKTDCKKVIAFDECFITQVGQETWQINSNSVCGQFLQNYCNIDALNRTLQNCQLPKCRSKSRFEKRERYDSGRVIQYGNDYLLMAFAKLDEEGLGQMTRAEYLDCLTLLWEEINKYYGQHDVAIPILGSGITRFKDAQLTKQELVDLMIASYKLSPYKIKSVLHIVCKKSADFDLRKVGLTL